MVLLHNEQQKHAIGTGSECMEDKGTTTAKPVKENAYNDGDAVGISFNHSNSSCDIPAC